MAPLAAIDENHGQVKAEDWCEPVVEMTRSGTKSIFVQFVLPWGLCLYTRIPLLITF